MRYLFISLLLIHIVSCKEYAEQKEKIKLQQKIELEVNSGVKHDSIFLDYIFGMSKEEFDQRTNELVESGKLQKGKKNKLVYKMTISDFSGKSYEEVESAYIGQFHNDELYQFIVGVEPININYTNIEIRLKHTQLSLLDNLTTKYGYDYFKEPSITIEDWDDYFWIDGNRIIKLINGIDDVRIIYTDQVRLEEKENEKIQIKNEGRKTLINDL